MEKVTINRRTRSLGYGWTNQPVQDGECLAIAEVAEPRIVGSLLDCEKEVEDACRLNSGNFWRDRLFYKGRPVKDTWSNADARTMIRALREEGEITVSYDD